MHFSVRASRMTSLLSIWSRPIEKETIYTQPAAEQKKKKCQREMEIGGELSEVVYA